MTRTNWRVLPVLVLALGALAFAATSSAHDGDHEGPHAGHHEGDGKKKDGHHAKHEHGNATYSTTLVTADSGCDGHVWANDTLKRTYRVHKNGDGSYTVVQFDRGTFLSVAGVSPQGCPDASTAGNNKHGTVITAGIQGRINGVLSTKVTGGTFNPSATCSATACTRDVFVASFFGATAKSSCDQSVGTDCRYVYVTRSHDASLKYRTWIDSGKADHDGPLKTKDHGDIATA
jgi:hypothetical protein